jgi:hypothetical protein
VRDVNLPDEAKVQKSQMLIKEWEFTNTGTEAWGDDFKLALIRDSRALSVATEYPVPEAKPGQTVTVSAVLQIPKNAGHYEAYFKMADGKGNHFGDRVWVKLNVESATIDEPTVDVKSDEAKDLPQVSSDESDEVKDLPQVSSTPSDPSTDERQVPSASVPDQKVAKVTVEDVPDDDYTVVSAEVSMPSAPAEAPKEPEQPPFPYPEQMTLLISMGFVDKELNAKALMSCDGDVEQVVSNLIGSA